LRIIWSCRALLNLDAIGHYLGEHDPGAAVRTLEAIAESVGRLASRPFRGRVGRIARTRELVIVRTPYIAVYRIRGDGLEILAVIHGARRWPKRI
jgi:toxin ParE1/3/4